MRIEFNDKQIKEALESAYNTLLKEHNLEVKEEYDYTFATYQWVAVSKETEDVRP